MFFGLIETVGVNREAMVIRVRMGFLLRAKVD